MLSASDLDNTPARPDALGPRFEVRDELGRGAMGIVYRAFDRQLGREVAVKRMLHVTKQRAQRLVREGQAVANLSHPGIVRVHEAGAHEGKHFLVCELVEGARTLDQVLPELDLEQRVALVRDAAAALGAAHGVGVVHRDVKPENLLVDANGRLFVTDFGLALIQGEDRLTRTGAMLGTPHYMSPEQVEGRRAAQGPPSDVWSLGVVLYLALTDRLPFEGANFGTLGYAIAKTPPVSPSALRPAADAKLAAVCLRALHKDPQQRYPTAASLADDLSAYIAGELAAPPRRRGALLAGGLALAGVAALLIAWLAPRSGSIGAAPPRPADPAPEDPAQPDPAAGTAERDYRAWAAQGNDLARFVSGRRFLRDHRAHAHAARVRTALRRLRTAGHPLAELNQDPVTQFSVWPTYSGSGLYGIDKRGVVITWDPISGQELTREQAVPVPVGAARLLAPPGEILFKCMKPDPGLVWRSADAEPRWLLRGHIDDDGLATNATHFAAGGPSGKVHMFERSTRIEDEPLSGLSYPANVLALSPDGRFAVAGGKSPQPDSETATLRPAELCFWELPTTLLRRIDVAYQPRVLSYGSNSSRVFVGSTVGTIECRDSRSGALLYELDDGEQGLMRKRAHAGSVRGIVPLSESRLVSLSRSTGGGLQGGDHQLRVWDLATRTLDEGSDATLPLPPTSLSVSHEFGLVAIGTTAGKILIYPLPEPAGSERDR